MTFTVAGVGDGTGIGAAPVIVKVTRETGILTAGVAMCPSMSEGPKHSKNVAAGIAQLR